MEPRLSFVTLGVSILPRAARFYEEIIGLLRILMLPEISFFEMGKTWLALYPRELLVADAGVPAAGSGIPGFSLVHNVRAAAEVDELLKEVAAKSGQIESRVAAQTGAGIRFTSPIPMVFSGKLPGTRSSRTPKS
jgi:uncharacterized protein